MRLRPALFLALVPALAAGVSVPAAAAEDPAPACPWVGSDAPAAERAAQLLAAMTLDDKLQMVHGSAGILQPYGPTYAGQVKANPRLCIPALSPTDGPAGVGNGKTGVTQLPAPIALGATWDRALARRYGEVIGAETVGKGANYALGPGLDIARDPRAGRHFEDLGEDPDLIGQLALQESQGIQSQGSLSVAKHLAAYTQETGRNTAQGDAKVDERTLQELYLAPYEPLVAGGVDSVMCSYNKVNGVHACNDTYTMTQVLKGQLGFRGFTISDWFGMHASTASANAGLDLQMPDTCYYDKRLRAAINDKLVPQARLDDMVRRITTQMFERGLFDRKVTGTPDTRVTNDKNAKVAQDVAAAGMVLMRNTDGLLPLDPARTRSMAVIGSAAGRNTLGSGGGSAHVVADKVSTPLEALAAEAAHNGTTFSSYTGAIPAAAADKARGADVAVVVVSKLVSESKDEGDLLLSATDRAILDAVTKANPNTVVVVNTGAPVDLSPAATARAVLAAWYPGQSYGVTLADVLYGRTNPSGRLPVTWPASQDQLPAAARDRFPGGEHSEGLAVGYRWYAQEKKTPLGAFGSGLSYTTFDYSGLKVGAETADGSFPVTVTVRNTGSRAGSVVPQVYVDQPAGAPATPRALKDFAKVALAPGESRQVTMTLTTRDLSHWDVAQHRWVRSAGSYPVHVGDSAVDLRLHGAAKVDATTTTSPATPAAPKGTPEGNETAGESLKDTFVCGNGGFMAGGVGLASYFGLAPQPQAVVAPTDDVR
ncbi:beta-glucosidase [Arsenicicoccus dermatophilus]|uniref:beta-glucosidase n=1 Tax=Arsenicicoccus dermatophilus TaxID=1076331 RepID=UPI001F4CF329|nr:glycoside hydrolase family 3 C-terminal domain-containing protein [Arsenicicoccus dermatophilus]MCH8612976.1 glycoside hydrolase family 3 C-terminal domain-containing protein [Arsenicicoccus dermatophilus]